MKHTIVISTYRHCLCSLLSLCYVLSAYSQKNNHTIASLIKADHLLQTSIAQQGINKGFIKLSDVLATTFKPSPVDLKSYYANTAPSPDIYTLQPAVAYIAKSGDFGITTGPYIQSEKQTADLRYGNYIAVWRSNVQNVWKLILHANIPSPGFKDAKVTQLQMPANEQYSKLLGPKKIQMRKDIVFSTDELLGKALNYTGNNSFLEYYSTNVTFLLANYAPLQGVDEILPFFDAQEVKILSEPLNTNRAFSGDLAYTYGKAILLIKNKKKTYSYIRVWQIQPDMKWYITIDAYLPL
jgi:ketosteroid isomerase-like protein